MNLEEFLKQVFEWFGKLGILSVGLNLWQFFDKKKLKGFEIKKQYEVKQLEFEELGIKHDEQRKKIEDEYGLFEIRDSLDLSSEGEQKMKELEKKQKLELRKVLAEMDYWHKLRTGSSMDITLYNRQKVMEEDGFWQRVLNGIKEEL